MILNKLKLTSTQFIAIGYLVAILIGSFLLSLPIASRSGDWSPYLSSLFTSTSATCVTGLTVYDTYTHWSLFGQIVILMLIQIGGIGFMTIITMFAMFFKKRIGLPERKIIMQSTGNLNISGVVQLIKKIVIGTLLFEGAGAIILAIRFSADMGVSQGIYFAVFHSVSAFCNAGFDLFGLFGQLSSVSHYANDIVVNLTLMLLIIIGGIGFLVWNDFISMKFRVRNFQLHSKIVLTVTAVLIIIPSILFFVFERNHSMSSLSTGNAILASVFQSVTTRTAGFASISQDALSGSGTMLTMVLMFIGGSPGSTAGGIKTTTFLVILLSVIASTRHKKHIDIFKHSLEENVVKQASTIATTYMLAIVLCTMLISVSQNFSFKDVLFEVMSALGTVGLTMGITPSLNAFSKIIIMLLMYSGRVGALSLIFAFAERNESVPISRPIKKIIIG